VNKKQRKYLKDLIAVNINKLVLYDGSFEYQFDGNTLSLVPENYGKRCFLAVFINGIRQQMSWDLCERPHRGTLKNSQIPYNRDTVFYVIGADGRRYRHLFLCPETNRLGTRVDFYPDHNRAYPRGKAKESGRPTRKEIDEMTRALFPDDKDQIYRLDQTLGK
jgi:hypothetical protein